MSSFSDIEKQRREEERKNQQEKLQLQQERKEQQKRLDAEEKRTQQIIEERRRFAKAHSGMIRNVLSDFANAVWGRNPFLSQNKRWKYYEGFADWICQIAFFSDTFSIREIRVDLAGDRLSGYRLDIIIDHDHVHMATSTVDEQSLRQAIKEVYQKQAAERK